MRYATWKTFEIWKSLLAFASDIKLTHSIFALPFAASVLFLVSLPTPSAEQAVWLVLAMIGARSFAMGFNRYADRILDFGNPRTRQRAIPSGRLSSTMALFWTLTSAGLFIFASFSLNEMAGFLSLPTLGLLAFYSYWKRFSWACHWYLGFCLGLAPVAVCVALVGSIPAEAVVLGCSIMLWTAGFDILYSLQDVTFDGEVGLKSVPSKFGLKTSLWISRGSFFLMVAGLVVVGLQVGAGPIYYAGMAGISAFLCYEHYLIKDIGRTNSLTNLNKAFFNQNAYVSIFYLAVVLLDRMFR